MAQSTVDRKTVGSEANGEDGPKGEEKKVGRHAAARWQGALQGRHWWSRSRDPSRDAIGPAPGRVAATRHPPPASHARSVREGQLAADWSALGGPSGNDRCAVVSRPAAAVAVGRRRRCSFVCQGFVSFFRVPTPQSCLASLSTRARPSPRSKCPSFNCNRRRSAGRCRRSARRCVRRRRRRRRRRAAECRPCAGGCSLTATPRPTPTRRRAGAG